MVVAAVMGVMMVMVVIGGMAGIMGTTGMVVCVETPLEGEPDELRFALEPERGVDDELPDIVKTPVHRQYAARVWVLRDRGDEDVRCEFGREVREGRHGEFRVLPPGESISLSPVKRRR